MSPAGKRGPLPLSQRSFSLASYQGQTVTLKFTGVEEISLQTSFVIDDTAVNVS